MHIHASGVEGFSVFAAGERLEPGRQAGDEGQLAHQRVPSPPAKPREEDLLRSIPEGNGRLELRPAGAGQLDLPFAPIVAGIATDPSLSLREPESAAESRAVENENLAQAPLRDSPGQREGLEERELSGAQPGGAQVRVVKQRDGSSRAAQIRARTGEDGKRHRPARRCPTRRDPHAVGQGSKADQSVAFASSSSSAPRIRSMLIWARWSLGMFGKTTRF